MKKDLIHFYGSTMCLDALLWDGNMDARITLSKDINEVTCPKCVYYYYRPEAKELERAFQNKRFEPM